MSLRNAFEDVATEGTLRTVAERLAAGMPADIVDRASRLLGYVAVANWPTVQLTDVADRAARLLGRVTVDNLPAVQRVTVENFAATQSTDVIDRSARLLGRTQLVETATGRLVKVDEAGALLTATAPRRSAKATAPEIAQAARSPATSVVVPANPNRLSVLLQNLSGDHVFIGYGAPPTLANGIRLTKAGGQLLEANYTGAIHATGDGGVVELRVLEVSL